MILNIFKTLITTLSTLTVLRWSFYFFVVNLTIFLSKIERTIICNFWTLYLPPVPQLRLILFVIPVFDVEALAGDLQQFQLQHRSHLIFQDPWQGRLKLTWKIVESLLRILARKCLKLFNWRVKTSRIRKRKDVFRMLKKYKTFLLFTFNVLFNNIKPKTFKVKNMFHKKFCFIYLHRKVINHGNRHTTVITAIPRFFITQSFCFTVI